MKFVVFLLFIALAISVIVAFYIASRNNLNMKVEPVQISPSQNSEKIERHEINNDELINEWCSKHPKKCKG